MSTPLYYIVTPQRHTWEDPARVRAVFKETDRTRMVAERHRDGGWCKPSRETIKGLARPFDTEEAARVVAAEITRVHFEHAPLLTAAHEALNKVIDTRKNAIQRALWGQE